jgi:hypothetical protein
MEKVLKITKLKDQQNDYAYWMSKTPLERLNAIELLREQYIKYNKDVQPGFQRVCKIINRKQG